MVIGRVVIVTDKAGCVTATEYKDIFSLLSNLMKLGTQKNAYIHNHGGFKDLQEFRNEVQMLAVHR